MNISQFFSGVKVTEKEKYILSIKMTSSIESE